MSETSFVHPQELGVPESFPLPKRSDWRIGLIGFGAVARSHIEAYQSVGWQVAAVADLNPAARKAAQEEYGVRRIYEDYRELIADPEVEIIDLLTQPTFREEAVRAAVAARKPIITEKPFGLTLAECERMVEMAARAGIALAVHQNYRWGPGSFLAHHIVRRGLIGAPFFASIDMFGDQDTSLADHPYYSRCEDFLTIHWNNHLVDLMRFWLSRDIVRTLAYTARMEKQSFVSDNLLCAINDFGSNLTGHIVHHELLHSSLTCHTCRIDGDEGSLTFELMGSSLLLHSKARGDEPRKVASPEAHFPAAFVGTMGDLLLALEEGREPMVSGRDNLETMRVIFAQVESAKQGGMWVKCGGGMIAMEPR